MDTLLQVAGLGLIAVLLGLVLKKGNGVLALLLTLAACAAMTVSIVRLAEPVVSFLSELRQLAGLEPALLQPLLRTVGIGLLTQLTASVCADAGESTVARLIELCRERARHLHGPAAAGGRAVAAADYAGGMM